MTAVRKRDGSGPERSSNVVWIGLTVGCMFVVLVVIALGALLLALTGTEDTAPPPATSAPDETTSEPASTGM